MTGELFNRRRFFQASAGGVVAGVLARNRAAEDSAPTRRRIPIGFLGASYSHGPNKIRIAMQSPDWEFVGVHDTTAAGQQTCSRLGAKQISKDELLRRAEVIAVESEVRDHARDGLIAVEAGKHVHLEKPPALRFPEMERIVEVARKNKCLLQTGYMWRYHPGFNAILEAARPGWLGDIFLVRGFISNSLPADRRAEWAEFPGGSMFELGSHLVDATVRLLGKPRRVQSFLRTHGKFNDTLKDNNVALLEYDHAMAVLVNTALHGRPTPRRSFEVLGLNGTATLEPIEPPTLQLDLTQERGPYPKGRQDVSLPPYQRYVGDMAELAAAVRGERPLSVTLDQELDVAETLLRVSGML